MYISKTFSLWITKIEILVWELAKAWRHKIEATHLASKWRYFSYEKQRDLLADYNSSRLCLQASTNSHVFVSGSNWKKSKHDYMSGSNRSGHLECDSLFYWVLTSSVNKCWQFVVFFIYKSFKKRIWLSHLFFQRK